MRTKSCQVLQEIFLSSAGFINIERVYNIQSEAYKAIQFGDFRTELIRQLIERYAEPKHPIGRPIIGDNPTRLTARHFPSLDPATATATENLGRRACIVCNHTSRREKKNTNARYQCDVCNVGLCVIGCFEDYHTLKHF